MKITIQAFCLTVGLSVFGFASRGNPGFAAEANNPPQNPIDTGTAPPTYEDVAPIFAANCQSCHSYAEDNALGGISVDTENDVMEHPELILHALETGWMPYMDSEWHNSPDGQKLIAWLKTKVTKPLPVPPPEE